MANSDISVPSVDHRQEPSTSTTFSIYGPCSRLNHLPPLHSSSNLGHQMEHVSKIDRRTTKHGARFRITVPEDRQRNIIQRLERQSKQTHWRIRQNYRHRRPDQTRPTAPPPPLSRQILAVNVANQQQTACYPPSSGTPGSGPSQRPASPHLNSALLSLDSMSSSIQPRDLDAEESLSASHRALVVMNMSQRRLLVFGKPSTELFRLTTTILFSFLETGTPTHSAFSALSTRGVMADCHAVSGSQITRLSTVHGRRHSSIDHFVCNAPARALLTSPRVDRQTAVVDHFVIRTSIRAEAQGQPPVSCSNISRHHCLEATDQIATSNYWDVLADGATTTPTQTQHPPTDISVFGISKCSR
ncbi:hypothetical protein BASA81_017756 [Batrachochytrium salamandrivorans]|nr:hypothetical protein BASA81_017756 [Batrachochytrium salamandrivorans]